MSKKALFALTAIFMAIAGILVVVYPHPGENQSDPIGDAIAVVPSEMQKPPAITQLQSQNSVVTEARETDATRVQVATNPFFQQAFGPDRPRDDASKLHALMMSEKRDPVWAGRNEARIRAGLQGGDSNVPFDVQCGSTVCEATAVIDKSERSDESVNSQVEKINSAAYQMVRQGNDIGGQPVVSMVLNKNAPDKVGMVQYFRKSN